MVKLGHAFRWGSRSHPSPVAVVNGEEESNCSLLTEDLSVAQYSPPPSSHRGGSLRSGQRFRQLNCLSMAQHAQQFCTGGVTSSGGDGVGDTALLNPYPHRKLISIDEEFGEFVKSSSNTTPPPKKQQQHLSRSGSSTKRTNSKPRLSSSGGALGGHNLSRKVVLHGDIDDDIDATLQPVEDEAGNVLLRVGCTSTRKRSARPRTTTAAQLCLGEEDHTMDAVMVESQLLNQSFIDTVEDSFGSLSRSETEGEHDEPYILAMSRTEDSYLLSQSATDDTDGSKPLQSIPDDEAIAIFSSSWDTNVAQKLSTVTTTSSPMTLPTTATSSPSTVTEQVNLVSPDLSSHHRAVLTPEQQFPFTAQALRDTKAAEQGPKHAVVTCEVLSDVSTLEGSGSPPRRLDLSLDDESQSQGDSRNIPDATPSVVITGATKRAQTPTAQELPPNQQSLEDILEDVIKDREQQGEDDAENLTPITPAPSTPKQQRQEEIVKHHRNLSRTAEKTPERRQEQKRMAFFPRTPPRSSLLSSKDSNDALLARFAKLEPFLAMDEAFPDAKQKKGPIYSAPINPLATTTETNKPTRRATAQSTVSSMGDLASSIAASSLSPFRRRLVCRKQPTPKPSYVGRRKVVSTSEDSPGTPNATRPFFWRSHPVVANEERELTDDAAGSAHHPRRCESGGEPQLETTTLQSRTMTDETDDDDESNLELWELIQVRNVLRQQQQMFGGGPTPSHATLDSDDVFFHSFPSSTSNTSGGSPNRNSEEGEQQEHNTSDGMQLLPQWPPMFDEAQLNGHEVTRIEL